MLAPGKDRGELAGVGSELTGACDSVVGRPVEVGSEIFVGLAEMPGCIAGQDKAAVLGPISAIVAADTMGIEQRLDESWVAKRFRSIRPRLDHRCRTQGGQKRA
jgi:hypothetical protein